ncbi:hypothetical protein CALCODRAFT_516704 [Calocera cornea HHB12733]|uniref:Peptidase S53 domain-containing protein n=1 Tax=Calocera cornea HHB12733 TaxID=1353952 RepID=A0A165GUH0_9BASI|nr:hypothetical protein CALCODRAFT_516704 [Calocera cornea HHB12733]
MVVGHFGSSLEATYRADACLAVTVAQAVRGGAFYVVAVDGEFELVFGTSCSSPAFGSVITLVNDARLALGKKPFGFLNPTLYANPWMMNDITTGGNQGCGTPGFESVPGWDPAGNGSLRFVRDWTVGRIGVDS